MLGAAALIGEGFCSHVGGPGVERAVEGIAALCQLGDRRMASSASAQPVFGSDYRRPTTGSWLTTGNSSPSWARSVESPGGRPPP
jgi:hypothetical protein